MNAPHPANNVFRAVKAMEPEFTRKLDFAEQTAMHAADPDKYRRYVDWLFAGNAGMTNRWARRERGDTLSADATHDKLASGADDYTVNPEQAGS